MAHFPWQGSACAARCGSRATGSVSSFPRPVFIEKNGAVSPFLNLKTFFLFHFNSSTEIESTYHTFLSFKVSNSVIFSMFVGLCNHHQNLSIDHFHHPQKTLSARSQPLSVSHSLPALGSPHLLAVSVDLPVSDMS